MAVERNFTIAVSDCLENPAPIFQPMSYTTKAKLGRYVRIFPVKYLAIAKAVVFEKVVFKREQLQIVCGAWCSK